jgi:DnaK suppressor protein
VKAPVKKALVKKANQVKKPVPAAHVKAKAKATAKPSPSPAKKAVAKPTAKKPVKAAPKAASKLAPQSVAKPMAKPAPKPATKSTAKPAAKVSKPAAKPVPKPKSVSAKTAPKKASVPSKSSQPVPKATAKPVAKTIAKAPAKPVAKTPAVKTPAPAAKAPVAKPVAKAAAPAPVKALPAPAPAVAPAKPKSSKSGFMSPGNIAPKPMEVSTAAKTHFTMSAPVLVAPPQVAVKKDAKLVNNWKTKTAALLTDAEAIAMPDSEYMNALQLAFFRLKLMQLKKDILNSAGETTEHLREDTSVVPDPADRATIEEEHALELRTRDRERKLLKKIEQSIARIDADDYGYCDETGEAIGVARLIARPTASLSLEAQQRRELKQKMFGD